MFRFTTRIRPFVEAEVRLASQAEAHGRFDTALLHLERAHVLGQRSTVLHVRVHRLMLRLALRNAWTAEAFAQLWRVAAAALFTPIGLVPAGNPGTARVNGMRRQPVASDLQRLIDAAE
jgi:hypothetical protein